MATEDVTEGYNYRRFHAGLLVERFEGGPRPGVMAWDTTMGSSDNLVFKNAALSAALSIGLCLA